MAHNGGKDLSPGFVARVAQGFRYMVRGVTPNDWFGPSQPLEPVAQEKAAGRQFDYPTAYNLSVQPRAYEPVSFQQLRGLADGYDLLRILIERRKDRVCSQSWDVIAKPGFEVSESSLNRVREFLEFPDKDSDFSTWLRAVLEDLFVIDAATLLPRRTKGGKLHSIELIDGATIKPLIDETGRKPLPPSPAYQQILKGVPAVDYQAGELLYMPRNKRSSRVYGFSQVEQIITTINIALRRQTSHLQYFTDGNIPAALISVPETWGPDEIERFQKIFDSLHSGNTGQRQKARFVPGKTEFMSTQHQSIIDPKFEEWIARVVCFAFGESYVPFVSQANYNQVQGAQQTAIQEGQAPIQKWIKGKLDMIIARYLDEPNIQFVWDDMDEIDPLKAAQADALDIKSKVKTPQDVQEERGLEVTEAGASGEPQENEGDTPQEPKNGSVSTDQES